MELLPTLATFARSVAILTSLWITYYSLSSVYCLWRNVRAAKASGLPYVILPVHRFNLFLLLTPAWIKSISKRFSPRVRRYLNPLTEINYSWNELFTIFQENGDTYLIVSPGNITCSTADADVIHQMTNRRADFPKPAALYRSINIFGANVISAEGQTWKHHRRIVSPPFSEKNNRVVWTESIHQAQEMVKQWMKGAHRSEAIQSVSNDTMRLSLHVISKAGFDIHLVWPGSEEALVAEEEMSVGIADQSPINPVGPGKGHKLAFVEAMSQMLDNLLLVVLLPKFLLRNLPFDITKRTFQSYNEWGTYMNEIFERKRVNLVKGTKSTASSADIMTALIQGSSNSSDLGLKGSKIPLLTRDEIIGNMFVFLIAGHETAANSINFSLVYLALHTDIQRKVQEELDTIFGNRSPSEWDYEQDFQKVFNGWTGAVLNEELRLIPPVLNIPKSTPPGSAQKIIVHGRECTVPANSIVHMSALGVHRNPRWWPTGPPNTNDAQIHPTSNVDNDLEEFKPQRWFIKEKAPAVLDSRAEAADARPDNSYGMAVETAEKTAETEDLGINTAADTGTSMYKPPKGAYIPFSEGYRACIGRRFAQVEVIAVLATVLRQCSIEFDVDVSDEEVDRLVKEGRKAELSGAYECARARARKVMRDHMSSRLTHKLRDAVIPLRFVERGGERFS